MILNKPYEKQAYMDFIAYANNHNCNIVDKGKYLESVEVVIPLDEIKASKIAELKAELAAYDYIGVKIAMGVATKEEYAEQIAYTQELRAKINDLEE